MRDYHGRSPGLILVDDVAVPYIGDGCWRSVPPTIVGHAHFKPLDMVRIIYGAIRLQGLLVNDFAEHHDAASRELLDWSAAGLIAHREDVRSGFDKLPVTFAGLFDGSHLATLIARIADRDGQPL